MLPTLPPDADLQPLDQQFVRQLRLDGFSGDIDTGYAARLSLATDNSAFQALPSALLFPRSEDDIATVCRRLADEAFHGVYMAPRGGGTSTIGCSLTPGLVLDCSRYMNRIIDIDPARRTARVQPGVVLDQLNDALAVHGLFFAPNVAPSSRATLGGMASTDGCGKGSRIHGKTSDHVLGSRIVLSDGSCHAIAAVTRVDLDALCQREDRLGEIHRTLDRLVIDEADEIARVYPALSRYLSGYNLAQLGDKDGLFNLNKLLCGSEGTLAIFSELTLKLTPLPAVKTLFALRYDSFDAALRDAELLVTFNPDAIETLDDKVMGLARHNSIYERVRAYIENSDASTPAAVNLVEFAAIDAEALARSVAVFDAALRADDSLARGYYRADQPGAIASLWELRKGGVGLLGSTPGDRKPLPFVEDTVVDPRNLAAYVADFRALLDEYGLEYGMFGHIDVGCLHVRPALNLADADDERIMREITDRVDVLVRRHGGMIWNEHGKGYRSQYNPQYFGERLYQAMCHLKRVFDPYEQLNPGKIVAADSRHIPLANMHAPTRGVFDRQIAPADRADFASAVHCNGNGACFNYHAGDIMCPSYRATRNRLHSPKGRAGAMREWLRLLSKHDVQTGDIAPAEGALWLRAARDLYRTRATKPPVEQDFSHQVWEAMDGCLSCRACATQCPVKVNVPDFKSRFLAMHHSRHVRPLADYAVACLESGVRLAAIWPRLANAVLARPAVQKLLTNQLGLSDVPRLSAVSVPAFVRRNPRYRFRADHWMLLSRDERQDSVIIIQDAFTSFFDAAVVIDVIKLVEQLGYRPLVADFIPSGKPLQVKGFLPEFQRQAVRTQRRLAQLAACEAPMIGIEPSVTLAYQWDYRQATGQPPPKVLSLEQWLVDIPTAHLTHTTTARPAFHLFDHCTSASAAGDSARRWAAIFDRWGAGLQVERVGCCGMSGAFGHETRHRKTSADIFDLSWRGALERTGTRHALATGYSCRSQVRRLTGQQIGHPASALRHLLDQG